MIANYDLGAGMAVHGQLKGYIGVGLELLFHTTRFRALADLAPLAVGAFGLHILVLLILRRAGGLRAAGFRCAAILTMLLAMLELRALNNWAEGMEPMLAEYELIIEAPDVDFMTLFNVLAEGGVTDAPTWTEDGRRVLRVPPLVQDRVSSVRQFLEERGYVVRRRVGDPPLALEGSE